MGSFGFCTLFAHKLLVTQEHLTVRHLVQLIEDTFQKQVIGGLDALEHLVNDSAESSILFWISSLVERYSVF